ncbi:MAG: hypothetical protein WAM70_11425 [Pyrinomonadaceae bacterium]
MDAKGNPQQDKTNLPLIVVRDLGSRKKKPIQDLKKGQGQLVAEVNDAIEEARAALPAADKNKTLVPVVIVYREKRKKRRFDDLPFNPLNPFSLFRC